MDESDERLRRLTWRCRRGMRELDQLLGAWLAQAWPQASASQQTTFDRLLDCEDDAIWDWLMGRAQPDCPALAELIQLIARHHQQHRASAIAALSD